MIDRIIVTALLVTVLALSIVSKLKRFRGSGNKWLVAATKGVWFVFWGLAGAMIDALLSLLAIASELPTESVVIIASIILLYMGLTAHLLKKAENSLSPTRPRHTSSF
jgi:predicted cobalt transporter CbtA